MPDHASLSSLHGAEAALAALIAEAEPLFRPVGDLLSDSIGVLGRMADGLYDLAARLQGEQAMRAAQALAEAVAGTRTLAEGARRDAAEMLARLEKDATEVSKHLGYLRRTVGDVTALAINGKIQSALVTTAGVDFTVFTSEIGRLGTLATNQIEQAAARLSAVTRSVAAAIEAEGAFARNEASELADIRIRLEANLSLLAERGRRAGQALDSVEARSRRIADRVAATVGQLQINDITCQRIDHVRLTAGEIAGRRWPDSSIAGDPVRIERAACELLQRQLDRAADDYAREIEAVIGNLRGLSEDAQTLLSEAEQAFGDSQGGLFLSEIERDVGRAVDLIDAYGEARQRTRAMVASASQGFLAMADDLEAIRSIDADMRIMGLNATLKCGRLGDAGRALGVVAQELRACSRRTEDTARTVGGLLESALANSRHLLAGHETEQSEAGTSPQRVMESSIADLSAVSSAMGESLDALRRDAPALSAALSGCAEGLVFHRRLRGEIDRVIVLIEETASAHGRSESYGEEEYSALRALMEPRYTMDGERAVHAEFDGRAVAAAPQAAASEAGSVDDLFF